MNHNLKSCKRHKKVKNYEVQLLEISTLQLNQNLTDPFLYSQTLKRKILFFGIQNKTI